MNEKLALLTLVLLILNNCVLSLKCYKSPIPYVLNYSVTIDTLPSFDNNQFLNTSGECLLTLMWFRNPQGSSIMFDSSETFANNVNPSDSIVASVQYQLEGEELLRRLSYDIQLKCSTSDGCNNEKNLKRLLNSIEIEERFEGQFDQLLASNVSFNNQSIRNCYFNRNESVDCSPIDYSNCHRCQTSVRFLPSSIVDVCATCPTITRENNFLVRDRIFLLTNRTKLVDRVQLSCQNGEQCNSMENIDAIRQYSLIDFDFDEYFLSSSSSISYSYQLIFLVIIGILI